MKKRNMSIFSEPNGSTQAQPANVTIGSGGNGVLSSALGIVRDIGGMVYNTIQNDRAKAYNSPDNQIGRILQAANHHGLNPLSLLGMDAGNTAPLSADLSDPADNYVNGAALDLQKAQVAAQVETQILQQQSLAADIWRKNTENSFLFGDHSLKVENVMVNTANARLKGQLMSGEIDIQEYQKRVAEAEAFAAEFSNFGTVNGRMLSSYSEKEIEDMAKYNPLIYSFWQMQRMDQANYDNKLQDTALKKSSTDKNKAYTNEVIPAMARNLNANAAQTEAENAYMNGHNAKMPMGTSPFDWGEAGLSVIQTILGAFLPPGAKKLFHLD